MLNGNTYMEKYSEQETTIPILGSDHEEIEFIRANDLEEKPELIWNPRIISSIGFGQRIELWIAAWTELKKHHSDECLCKFWHNYASESACKERLRLIDAIAGPTESENIKNLATRCIYANDEEDCSYSVELAKNELADWIIDCVRKQNPAPLRALAQSLGKWNFYSDEFKLKSAALKTRLLYKFCKLLQRHRALPTRIELETEIGIIRQVESGKASSKNIASALKSLGLDALPK